MAKYYGKIGYIQSVETKPGVWVNQVTEKPYFGDINRISSRYQNTDKLNDDITMSNELSIVADAFAYENFQHMKYAEFMGTKWKITNADASSYPRIILTLGGLYNGAKQT